MSPLSPGDFLMPRFQRPFGPRVPLPEHSKSPLGDNPHYGTLARSQYGIKLSTLPTDLLHDIGKSSRQDLPVEMLQNIASATRTKFLAHRGIAIQSEHLDGQVF